MSRIPQTPYDKPIRTVYIKRPQCKKVVAVLTFEHEGFEIHEFWISSIFDDDFSIPIHRTPIHHEPRMHLDSCWITGKWHPKARKEKSFNYIHEAHQRIKWCLDVNERPYL